MRCTSCHCTALSAVSSCIAGLQTKTRRDTAAEGGECWLAAAVRLQSLSHQTVTGNLAERRICVEKSGKFGFCPSCNCFAKTMPDQEAPADTTTPLKDSTDFNSIMPTAGRKKQTQSTQNPVRCNAPECWTAAKVWMCAILNKLERKNDKERMKLIPKNLKLL